MKLFEINAKKSKIFRQTIDERGKLCYNIRMISKRALALDIGNKRIGVAISDPFNEYAMPCETFVRTRDIGADARALAKLAKDKGVGVIVCGMPFNYDGTEGIQTVKTREFIEQLRERTDLPIELEDERFTTMQARETQIMGGIKCADRKKTIDSIAASYILESYLARQKMKNKREESQMNNKEMENEIIDEEDRIFEFVYEDGYVEKLYMIASLEYRGTMYYCMQKAEPETEEEEDLISIFTAREEGEEVFFDPVEDDELLDEVFAEFCHQYENSLDSDEAEELDD